MGWNSKTLNAPFSANWRDNFDEAKLDKVVEIINKKVQELVQQELDYFFNKEVEAGDVEFYIKG
jgi:hypothetical protein